jgi:triosephosphate isomerase
MARDAGCTYVLCGHSERRSLRGETDEVVRTAMGRVLEEGLTPVLCVGEVLEERRGMRAREVVLRQLDAGLEALRSPSDPLVVAYEPVWAIGTGLTATPDQASEAHGWIRSRVAAVDRDRAEGLRILYGGSVNPGNIEGLLDAPDVDGALVGGAALDPEAFSRIVTALPGGAGADA